MSVSSASAEVAERKLILNVVCQCVVVYTEIVVCRCAAVEVYSYTVYSDVRRFIYISVQCCWLFVL